MSARRAIIVGAGLLLQGCSSYWPLSDDLEKEIRSEADTLSPRVEEDDAVFSLAADAAAARLAPPAKFALPEAADLDDYVRLALERNPRIQARIRELEGLGFKVPQVTSLDDPTLAFGLPTGDMIQTAAGQVQATIGVSQKIPFPAKLAARGRVAEQIVRIGLENLRAARLEVVARVKQAYYSYYLSSVSITITRENEVLLRHIRDVAAAKFRSGTTSQQDVLRAEVELYELTNSLLNLEQEMRTSVALLNVLMDRAVGAELAPPPPFDPQGIEWKLEHLMARAVALNPELAALRQKVQRDIEAISLARWDYAPDFAVGAGYSFIGSGISPVASGADAWNLTLGMSLPVWLHRIRAGILERNAEALADTLRYRGGRNDIFFALQDSLVRVDTRYRSAILFRDAIVPRARQTVEASESGYQSGRVEFLTWIDNWRRLLGFTLQYHANLAALEREFATLELLAGGGLARTSTAELRRRGGGVSGDEPGSGAPPAGSSDHEDTPR